jgi:hypothetical protein
LAWLGPLSNSRSLACPSYGPSHNLGPIKEGEEEEEKGIQDYYFSSTLGTFVGTFSPLFFLCVFPPFLVLAYYFPIWMPIVFGIRVFLHIVFWGLTPV